jgi:diguanylate cyclase (GGDEF)-like protein/PAS domain S-box-containing protein
MLEINKELLSTKNILYIEDDLTTSEEVSFFLKNYIANLYIAKNGLEGLELFNSNHIDLVITDIQMPIMDGLSMSKKIKEENNLIPIIIVSAFNETDMLLEAINLGIDAYLIKPLSLSKLIKKIEVVLTPIEIKKELYDSNEKLKLLKKLEATEKELLIYKERVDFAFRATQEALWDWNIKENNLYISERWKEMLGYDNKDIQKNNIQIWIDSVYEKDMEDVKRFIFNIFANKISRYELKYRQVQKNKNLIWILTRAVVEYDQDGNPIRMIGTNQDITKEKEKEKELKEAKMIAEKLSITDGLTGLYNRRYFNKQIGKELNRSKRDKKHIAFLMLDVDHFKQYNDTYGHLQGDDALMAIAEVLKEFTVRAEDTAFRLGGEEFGIIFFPKDIDETKTYAQNILNKIESLQIEHKNNLSSKYITVSLGIIFKEFDLDLSMDEIYQKADEALYYSKVNGRNQVKVVYG